MKPPRSSESNQTEIRFTVDSEVLEKLQASLGASRATDITRAALTLLNWAVDEVGEGRLILSANKDGDDIHKLVMPELQRAAMRK
jgi:hypothetical protein